MELRKRVITVICDSLRRDFISAEKTPVLAKVAERAAVFLNARSVFPSTTRTSSASIATGCTPARHGLMGNCVILREASGLRCHNVGDPAFVDRLREITGTTLKVPTVAEHVRPLGLALLMSNVSAGAAYFYDPEGVGEVWHRAGSFGPGRKRIVPNIAQRWESGAVGDAAMTQTFCERVEKDDDLVSATLWLSDPDHSGHRSQLGSPEHLLGIAAAEVCVDAVSKLVARLRERGDDVLLIVGSDHGMQTISENIPVTRLLVDAGLKAREESHDVVIAPNGTAFTVGVSDANADRTIAIAAWLRKQVWAGEVLTGDQLASIGLLDDETCRIAVSMRSDHSTNQLGVPGTSLYIEDPDEPGDYVGRGQHGGLGTYEQSPFLMIDGAHFAPGPVEAAVSLVDILPTLLRHLELPFDGLDGRALQAPSAH